MAAYNSRGESTPTGYGNYAINQYTKDQQKLFGNQFGQLQKGSYLDRLANGDEEIYNEMEAPQLKQYSGEIGKLSSYFSGMGTGGRKSSGFQNTMNQSASDFASNLQKNRSDMRNQAIKNLMGLSDQVLNQRPQERGLTENAPDDRTWDKIAGAGIGGIGGLMMGQPMQGAQMGYNLAS